ncbi:hypothetical protein AGMMS50225_15200 [Betaproteobacteria bacterium]|nr:hypothetical protein AGMMS50225_15200 [Betaproteobacteria bacterium]
MFKGEIPFGAEAEAAGGGVLEVDGFAGGEVHGVAGLMAPEVLGVEVQFALLGEFQGVACADMCAY